MKVQTYTSVGIKENKKGTEYAYQRQIQSLLLVAMADVRIARLCKNCSCELLMHRSNLWSDVWLRMNSNPG